MGDHRYVRAAKPRRDGVDAIAVRHAGCQRRIHGKVDVATTGMVVFSTLVEGREHRNSVLAVRTLLRVAKGTEGLE